MIVESCVRAYGDAMSVAGQRLQQCRATAAGPTEHQQHLSTPHQAVYALQDVDGGTAAKKSAGSPQRKVPHGPLILGGIMDATDAEVTERDTQLLRREKAAGSEAVEPGRGAETIGERVERRVLFVQQRCHGASDDYT